LWMSDWIKTRDEKKQKKEEKALQIQQPVDEATQAKRDKQREKTEKEREEKVQRGIKELELWLRDLTRRGLVNLQSQSYEFWGNVKKRMNDAQAPGLATIIQEMEGAIVLKENWSNRFMTRLAQVHLLLESYSRIEQFPEEQQSDIRTLIGWTQTKDEVLQNPAVRDRWQVLGQYKEEDEKLMIQRIWFFGQNSKRFALILNFAFGAAKRLIDRSWVTGTELEGELVFYPGNTPLRALAKEMGTPTPFKELKGYLSIRESLDTFKKTLQKNPWIDSFPMILESFHPQRNQEKWFLVDNQNEAVPLHHEFTRQWDLVALSGGEALTVFGEWRFDSFWPLGVWIEQQYWELAPERISS
ncbi:MAG: SWIM zinc finger family protein, partial [Planctomycetota bacterium]